MDDVLIEGRYLERDREIILGYKLAEELKYSLGDTIKVMSQTSEYALNMRSFKVVGIFKSGLGNLDGQFFQVALDDAQKLLKMEGVSQQIIIMLQDYNNANAVAIKIRETINDESITVRPWTEIGFAYNYTKMAETMYGVIYLIIALMGAFIIGNIMLMVVMERKREIGIMKSMGFTPRSIQFLFLTEGVILGTVGSFIAITLSLVGIALLNIHGVDISSLIGGIDNMGFDNIVYFDVSAGKVLLILGIGIFVSAFVSLAPARKAAKLSPVDSIRA